MESPPAPAAALPVHHTHNSSSTRCLFKQQHTARIYLYYYVSNGASLQNAHCTGDARVRGA